MLSSRAFIAILSSTLLLGLTSPALGQNAAEWRVGAGYLISRPNDARLWGLNVRREQRLGGLLVYRGIASVDGITLDPTLVTVGADIGLRAHLAPLSLLVAVGPTLGYFLAPRDVYSLCQGSSCTTVQNGYEPGLLLAATGSLSLGLQVSTDLQVFAESRAHLPSGIGRSGFSHDPHAAFVELAFGVSLVR